MSGVLPPERWHRVGEVFDAAVPLDPAARAALLAEACGDDESLRQEIESLLDVDRDRSQAIGDGILAALNAEASSLGAAQVIERIGPYRLRQEIGRGGVGTVYLAEREDDFSQRVAIKIVRGFMGPDALRRFRTERQILASLEHPSIARLLDGGTTAEGVPYLVMEYVEGVPIDVYCESHHLTTRQRLELFIGVCDAVSYAHRSLVVHRDLKASNILVTADGVPKLLDFGIAKLVDEEQTDALQTTPSLRLLTPEYASPEQVRGQPITTATDVYSLGVLLFELLTGARPHRLETRRTAEIERIVCEQAAPRPSTSIKRDGAVARQLTGDLDTIVLKALEKEPSRRYMSVEQFGDDIRRHLDGHPVLARPATWRYRSSRFVRRHQKAVATAAAVAVVIVALGTALVLYAARATRERNNAQRMTSLLVELFSNTGQSGQGASMTVSELLDRGTERVKRELSTQPDLQAQLLDAIGSIYVDLGMTDRAQDALSGAVAARQSAGALDSMAAARTMILLADALRQRGQYAAAEPLARSAVEMGTRVAGSRNPQVAQWAITLAQILHATGERKEAEALFEQTTQIFRETLGPEHPMVALGLSGSAAVRKDLGDLRGAEQLARDALAIVTRVFGQATADRLAQVAEVVDASGRGEEAEALLRDAVAQRRRAFGAAGHPSLAPALEQLAAQLRANGKAGEAEALEQEARSLAGKQ